jgi:hypothetical protein
MTDDPAEHALSDSESTGAKAGKALVPQRDEDERVEDSLDERRRQRLYARRFERASAYRTKIKQRQRDRLSLTSGTPRRTRHALVPIDSAAGPYGDDRA